MCWAATAAAPSWRCPATTPATWNLRRPLTCRCARWWRPRPAAAVARRRQRQRQRAAAATAQRRLRRSHRRAWLSTRPAAAVGSAWMGCPRRRPRQQRLRGWRSRALATARWVLRKGCRPVECAVAVRQEDTPQCWPCPSHHRPCKWVPAACHCPAQTPACPVLLRSPGQLQAAGLAVCSAAVLGRALPHRVPGGQRGEPLFAGLAAHGAACRELDWLCWTVGL